MSLSIREKDIRTALKAFIVEYLEVDPDSVVAAYNNRVPLPYPGILMTPLNSTEHATNVNLYDGYSEDSEKGIQGHETWQYQIDFYGKEARNWATVFSKVFRNITGCDFLRPYGIQPLYAEQRTHPAFVDEDEQYKNRTTVIINISCYPVVTVKQEYIQQARIKAVNAEIVG